jgi:hypothetical protein
MNISKETIIVIFLLFAFSGKLWDFMWKIGMALVYITVIIFILNSINPTMGNKVKEMFSDFVNLDFNTVKNIVADISKSGLSILKQENNIKDENNNINQENNIKDENNNINQENNNINQENNNINDEYNEMIEKSLNRNFTNIGSNNNLRHLV